MTMVKTIVVAAALAIAASAGAQAYHRYGAEIGKSDHWDNSHAPFARYEGERFTQ